ncbi:type II toxin-antitoxin system VapC family toxin [Indioceanicola profundi]|uniref:type II toxin-antitoxin system VapC family toxin n=1 Tax=Indioceanicola profundi TaxID=2220096 RepID=UPI001969578F|nr:type II toxin-antitoxin system VapC family toxin [Indioceanicola profundi]
MIVLDTSILVAILLDEPEAERLRIILNDAPATILSAVNHFEARMLLRGRYGVPMLEKLDALLADLGTEIIAFDRRQSEASLQAFNRFGKGQGHPAQLNLADCCAYALAKTRGLPLLFKGGDFSQTDIQAAAY